VLSVMNHETSQGVFRGRSASPTAGLRNRRIQNLDSPMAPGSPIPEPAKHPQQNMGFTDDTRDMSNSPYKTTSPPSSSQSSLHKHPSHSETAMAFSRSQEGFRRASHASPEHMASRTLPSPSPQPSPTVQTPLLMPPPPTRLGALTQSIEVARHHLQLVGHRHGDSIQLVLRLLLFLVKLLSLAKPCWPYMVNLEVGVPLMTIAAIDLGIPAQKDPYSRESGLAWNWGLRTSVTLLIVHFLGLWLATRWTSLCALAPHWMDW
jgi:hypothetical protein